MEAKIQAHEYRFNNQIELISQLQTKLQVLSLTIQNQIDSKVKAAKQELQLVINAQQEGLRNLRTQFQKERQRIQLLIEKEQIFEQKISENQNMSHLINQTKQEIQSNSLDEQKQKMKRQSVDIENIRQEIKKLTEGFKSETQLKNSIISNLQKDLKQQIYRVEKQLSQKLEDQMKKVKDTQQNLTQHEIQFELLAQISQKLTHFTQKILQSQETDKNHEIVISFVKQYFSQEFQLQELRKKQEVKQLNQNEKQRLKHLQQKFELKELKELKQKQKLKQLSQNENQRLQHLQQKFELKELKQKQRFKQLNQNEKQRLQKLKLKFALKSIESSRLNEPIKLSKWSEQLKDPNIKINRNVVTNVSQGWFGSHQLCLLNVGFSRTLDSKQSWKIQIIRNYGWIRLGICLKNKMAEYKFDSRNKINYQQTGHGLYMIQSNGWCSSGSQKEFNYLQDKSFKFGADDVIMIEFDPVESKLVFIKNESEYFEMPIIPPPENDEYHPFVRLFGIKNGHQSVSLM